jgi:hypothetical protein
MTFDWNKRMKTKDVEKIRKKKQHIVMKHLDVEEVLDETGEVTEDTVVKIKFEDIINIHISIAAAMKLNVILDKILKYNN